MTSPLPDPRTPMSVPAGSTHVRTCRVRTHARTHLQGMHARTHACTGPVHACMHALDPCMHARTRPMHACSHWVPTPARSRGPCTLARTGSPRLLTRGAHARTLAPGPHARFVSMHTRTGSGSPCPLARRAHARTHARTHRVFMLVRSWGPHARTHRAMRACSLRVPTPAHTEPPPAHTGPPCPLDCGVPMHVCRIPALVHAASHVVCSSSCM